MKRLTTYAKMSVEEQQLCQREIVEQFAKFWKKNPTKEEFARNVNGLVLFPEMLYELVKK
jgi:hypothetical protein